jgi:hypothetical protein
MSDRRQAGRAAVAQLSPAELAEIAVGVRELAERLDGFRQRLAALERGAQALSGSTSRSTRARRSSTRSRSS